MTTSRPAAAPPTATPGADPVLVAPADPAAPGARRTALIVGVLAIAVFMSSLDLFIVNLAFPYIGREYQGTTLSALSWVLNGYTIVFAAVLVPAGRWADRIGRRRAMTAGLALFTAGSVLCGLAPGVGVLIAARVVQAAGAGIMVPASLSLLLAAVPPAGRAKAIGTWSALAALGAALGPVIGGSLVQLSWRWVFWINVPIGLAAIVLAARVIPESRDEHSRGRPDLAGAALLALSVGLVALALVKVPVWGWGSARFLGLLAAAVASGAVLVIRSHRHHAPVIELGLLRSRMFSGTFAASVLYYAGFGAFVLTWVEFLTGVWHYSPVRAGLAIAPGPLTVIPVAMLTGRLAARFGHRPFLIGGALLYAATALWFMLVPGHEPSYLLHWLPGLLMSGASVGLVLPSLSAAAVNKLPAQHYAVGSAVNQAIRQIGSVIGVAIIVLLLGHATVQRSDFDAVYALQMGLALLTAALCAMVDTRPAVRPS